MFPYTLYTYSSLNQLRQIQQTKNIIPFVFGEAKDVLVEYPDSSMDITALIYYLRVNKNDCIAAYNNLKEMSEDTTIIVDEILAEDALSFFPYLFSAHKPFFEPIRQSVNDQIVPEVGYTRQPIYTYHNIDDLNIVVEYAKNHNMPIATFSRISGNIKTEVEKFNQSAELTLLDLTSTSYAIEDNKNLIYSVELFMNQFPNIKLMSLTSQIDKIVKYFPLYVEGQKPLSELLPDITALSTIDSPVDQVKKATALTATELEEFIDFFNHYLIGHNHFKERFIYSLRNFIALNKVKEQKVFSLFLFGASGIGKTEVARLLANGLHKDSYLIKINFQNYSSQDALNSLIGSPAGYIGCEHGELSDKVKKSNVGVVLCDEFEKTTRPVFSFFLELLEDGKFTDSMAREYDLDGYILVFTSNLRSESDYQKIIPPELQTRFDLVCEFQEPSFSDKTKFIDLLMEQAETKFHNQFSAMQLPPEEKQKFYDFNYSNVNSLRDIKRSFNNRLMDLFAQKGL